MILAKISFQPLAMNPALPAPPNAAPLSFSKHAPAPATTGMRRNQAVLDIRLSSGSVHAHSNYQKKKQTQKQQKT